MNNLRSVIFDMDGVLCDSEPFICEAACRMFKEKYGRQVAADDFIPFVGAGEDRYLGGVAEKYGLELELPSDKERTYAIYLEIIRGRLGPLPGVHAFVEWCGANKVQMAVASSADRIKVDGNLREIGLPAKSFAVCISGSDIKHKKPAPDIFIKAAELLGVTTENCLVVEDAVNGIQAGCAAGSHCLGLTTSFDAATLSEAGAEWTAPNLGEIPAAVYAFLAQQRSTAPANPSIKF